MQRLRISLLALALAGCSSVPPDAKPDVASPAIAGSGERYDLLIRNGIVYDGSGAAPPRVDVAVRGDRVVALWPAGNRATATQTVDAHGQAPDRGIPTRGRDPAGAGVRAPAGSC